MFKQGYYDMVIIGAGPAGLALAHCCSLVNKKILVIDKETNIGGCHRVKRVAGGLFTEHGPRVYLTNYINFFYLLSEIGLHKDEIFTNYKYNIGDTFFKFGFKELVAFALAYITYLFNNNYGESTSLVKFCKDNAFPEKSIETLDRLCRFMDGADMKKYSLGKLLKIVDSVASVVQPKAPLDTLLFEKWQSYLESRGVEFALGHNVSYMHYCNVKNKIDHVVMNNKNVVYCNKVVLAIPPAAIIRLLHTMDNKIIQNCFGNLQSLEIWNEQTEYIEYISITYHFKGQINIPEVQGLTFDTDWGIIALNLSDYMQDIEAGYDRVLSVAITICDKTSRNIHKTANECNEKELYEEVYRQLKQSIYPHLPMKYTAIINPNNHYDKKEKKWKSADEAYFNTIGTHYIPFQSATIPNIYNLGTHNGQSYLVVTTLEAALSNGMVLACKLYPQLRRRYYLRKSWKISDIVYISTLLILFMLICVTYFYYYRHIQY